MLYEDKLDIEYLRLSKEDGDVEDGTVEESCSIGSQRKCIHQFLRRNGDDPLSFEEIVDDGYSGTSMNRPGMKKILRLIEAGRVRTIIVRDLSRFARNYLEAGHYLEFVFPAYGVRFISVNDNYDSARYGETTGGLELAVKNLINQLYSKDLSRKIKSVVDLTKVDGEWVYGTAPYGYKKGEKKNTIVVDVNVSWIVKSIFDWAASGITITEIARKLNDLGIMTPSVYLAPVRGKYKTRAFWTFESVRNILSNRIYTGDTVPFKSHVVRVGSDRVKQIPEEEQIIIPNTHEAIVSRELFYQARLVIKSNKKSKRSTPENPFSSLLVCDCCGNKLTKGKAQNKNWLCASRRYTSSTGCSDVRIEEAVLEKIVLRAIVMQCQVLDVKVKRLRENSYMAKTSEQILSGEIKTLRMKISQLEDSKMQLYEEYVEKKITKDEYLVRKENAAKALEQMKLQLSVSENKLKDVKAKMRLNINQIEETDPFIRFNQIDKLTPELTKELIKRIIVRQDGSIRIEWNFSDEIAQVIETPVFAEYKAV